MYDSALYLEKPESGFHPPASTSEEKLQIPIQYLDMTMCYFASVIRMHKVYSVLKYICYVADPQPV